MLSSEQQELAPQVPLLHTNIPDALSIKRDELPPGSSTIVEWINELCPFDNS